MPNAASGENQGQNLQFWPYARAEHAPTHSAFRLAWHDCRIARAFHGLAGTMENKANEFATPVEQREARAEAVACRQNLEAAIENLMRLPAGNGMELRCKVDIVGRVWLSAEGAPFAGWRAAIAQDAERLGQKNPLAGRKVPADY